MSAPPAQPATERLKILDRALARFSSDSLLTLLRAALDSPGCARFHDHLLLTWTRVLRRPRRPGPAASAGDLPAVLAAARRAAPGRGVMTEGEPNDVRAGVRVGLAGEWWLVHPGELDHPLVFLRAVQATARAVDDEQADFTLTEVLELVLRHTHHTVAALAPAWPTAAGEEPEGEIACTVTDAEVTAAGALGLDHLTAPGPYRERAAKALGYLTADIRRLPLRYTPGRPLLGAVLLVVAHGRRVPVPASVALNSLAAAAAHLLAAEVPDPDAEMRLRLHTIERVAQLLDLTQVPVRPEPVCRIQSISHRLEYAVVAAFTHDGLSALLEQARTDLSQNAAPGAGRLVIYGGPRVLGPEVVTDTLYLHVEEFAEILADAGGDLATVAWWVLEMTEHPEVEAVAYDDVFDAWALWHREGMLLPPGPPAEGVALVPSYGRDVSWDRAAAWARIDDVLADAGLPPSLAWRTARLEVPEKGAGQWVELFLPGDAAGPLLARVSTVPPLVILTTALPDERALLDAATLAALADGIRATVAGHPALVAHFTLPDRAAWLLHLTETLEAHQPPPAAGAEDDASDEVLPLLVSMDPDHARISIKLDPAFLARFTDDGHQILGRLLHHCAAQIRQARGADAPTTVEAFTAAWNAAAPVLTLHAADGYQPAPAPPQAVHRSRHVHARALRTAAAAVRRARVPVGVFTGSDAVRQGGPAERLLTALEQEFAEQVRAHHPELTTVLARQLNAALSVRTRGRQEALVNLAAAGTKVWAIEAQRREADGSVMTNALQHLLQQAIASPPAGRKPADVLAVAELLALAELVLRTGLTAVTGSRRLHDLHLEVHDTGVFTLTDTPDPSGAPDSGVADQAAPGHLGFDHDAYRHAQQQRWISRARAAVPTPLTPDALFALHRRVPVPFTPLNPPPGSHLARADQVLHQQWDCGLDALAAVLATAVDWPTGPDGTAITTHTALAAEAAAWSLLPEADLRAAISRLLLDAGNAASDRAHAYTEVERRTRLTTHPLIAQDGRILLLPWLIHTAQQVYGGYLADARLPRPDMPPKAAQHLDRHRQQHNDQLEHDLKTIAERADLPHRSRLEVGPAAQLGIPGLPGEIDLLVADERRQRLWVIEAKNPHGAIAPHNLAQHLHRFSAYRTKLLAKTTVITAHSGRAAVACGVVSADRTWRVIPLIVTRVLDPAAFTADPAVPFTTADQLAQTLTADADPRPGWNAVPAAEQ
ncbi:hypothetical protein DQ384_39360 [Sphaerisporangium album]|uniref:Uncharacterized protein n=1 Tax=Sphaerisporangium album TaxID=509200 RepID=A0A367EJV1_9ACTN|nr:hypothetical protein [Sphaerisporangium album]RCG17905.1 hypothetical protein DQ384_39360 [Sphaerisporangium album]